MQTLASSAKRHISAAVLVLFLAAIALPSILAANVSAALLAARSIELSSSNAGEAGVTYGATFTPSSTAAIQGIVIDFCTESPIIGSACTTPGGLVVPTAAPTVTGITGATWTVTNTDGSYRLSSTPTTTVAGTPITVEVAGFTNPSAVGTFYARILTFATTGAVTAYTSIAPGTSLDEGGVALSTTNNIEVSAVVAEKLIFKVGAATAPTELDDIDDGDTAITLGEGSPAVLETGTVSEDSLFFGFETNAQGNTSVRIKSDSIDLSSGTPTIPGVATVGAYGTPTLLLSVAGANSANTGAFGFRVNAITAVAAQTLATAYGGSTPFTGNALAAVEGTYGDVLTTTTGPQADVISELTFAATAGSASPAGRYTGSFSLIATPSY